MCSRAHYQSAYGAVPFPADCLLGNVVGKTSDHTVVLYGQKGDVRDLSSYVDDLQSRFGFIDESSTNTYPYVGGFIDFYIESVLSRLPLYIYGYYR